MHNQEGKKIKAGEQNMNYTHLDRKTVAPTDHVRSSLENSWAAKFWILRMFSIMKDMQL